MRRVFLGMFLLMLISHAAMAQTGKHVAIGGAVGFTQYIDKDFSSKNPGVSIAYRINLHPESKKDGWTWAPKSGLGWSKRKTSTDIGGTRTQLGKLQTILIMGGVQRVLHKGPWEVGIGVVGGASINDFKVDAAARDAYIARLSGATLDDIKVKNSLAVRPEISGWYDLNKWLGVQGSVSYLYNRPKAETTVSGVTTTSTWKTDHASVSVGLVVGIF